MLELGCKNTTGGKNELKYIRLYTIGAAGQEQPVGPGRRDEGNGGEEDIRSEGDGAAYQRGPLRDDSALRPLLSLRVLRGAPAVPPLCRETQSLGQQMLDATVGINGLMTAFFFQFIIPPQSFDYLVLFCSKF